ncbi:MAG: hypothetical protein COW65_13945 [Cytophagales bacterium CG18_big_fil_WC_8_21_14_2_50_42_9]|nr:MAG: hypothetical protein COW65_13945 [Cytophagales bacterium CG18_big_fil_WC_8_21_14_2_50_42_9]
MLSQITIFLDVISPWALLLYFFIKIKKARRRDYIFWFILFQTIINTVSIVYDQYLILNNLYLYHLNCAVSFFILTIYFSSILNFQQSSNILYGLLVIFGIFFFVNIIKWENLESFNSNSYSVASFLIVVYSFLYYLENLLRPATIDIAKSKNFWYVTGLFTYYAGSFYIFLTFKKLTFLNIENLRLVWLTHNVLFLILCIFLARGIICQLLQEKYNL